MIWNGITEPILIQRELRIILIYFANALQVETIWNYEQANSYM